MNKKALTEADIRTKFITPALVGINGEKWNVMPQISEKATRASVINLVKALVAELTDS